MTSTDKVLQKSDSGAATSNALTETPKGIVDPAGAASRFQLRRHAPSPVLQTFVDFYWIVEWDMRGREPQMQRVLPYPNAHLVFDEGRTAIHGVVRGAFDREIVGAGRVLGIRFKPGGLRPFIDRPLSALADRTMPVDDVLGIGTLAAERRVLEQNSDAAMIDEAETMLSRVLPQPDPRAGQAAVAVDVAAAENGPVSVEALAEKVGFEERTLQRLFGNYVGVSPKWVIQRFRLQEATWRLSKSESPNLSGLAQELGFFDQAHFTRSFTALVGRSPLDYWKSQAAGH